MAISNWSSERDNTETVEKRIQELKKNLKKYKKAYEIMSEYFDSISDEEQPKVAKKLKKLGL